MTFLMGKNLQPSFLPERRIFMQKYIRLPVVPSDEAITLVVVPFFQGALVH